MTKGKLFGMWAVVMVMLLPVFSAGESAAFDLKQIRERGVLRHLGVPYANFVTGSGGGLDVELMQRFADYLGVKYQYVKTDWENVFEDLTGKRLQLDGDVVRVLEETEIRGDVIANGLTILPWREQVVDFSAPTFPTQVWCIARSDSPLKPIQSSGDTNQDIKMVKELLKGVPLMGKNGTCLAPGLYGFDPKLNTLVYFEGSLNDIAPALIAGEANAALLDVPDTLIALGKWSGKIKVIGPVSSMQNMGVGFRKVSPELLAAFNVFFEGLKKSGEYEKLVKKYYPTVFNYYSSFFQ